MAEIPYVGCEERLKSGDAALAPDYEEAVKPQ